jgi:amino acid transporter
LTDTVETSASELLEHAGYRQELDRALSVLQTVGLSLSDITPTASFFIIAASVYPIAGTGAFWTFLIAGALAICVASCMAELGSQYPIAGGLYSIVIRVLGRPLGFVAMTDYVVQAVILPVAVVLGVGTYLQQLVPSLNPNVSGTVLMLAITVLALFRIRTNAIITGVFLALELVVMAVVAVLGIAHPVNGLSTLVQPALVTAKGTQAVAASVVLTTVGAALFAFNGYDSAINFSEETSGSARNVGRAVMNSAGLGVGIQVVVAILVLVGVPSLPRFFGSSLPVYQFVQGYLGTGGANVMVVGVALAVLNATLAVVLQFSRVVYSTARDESWPGPVNRLLSYVHPRFRAPWGAVLLVGLVGTGLTFFGSVISAITFTSTVIVVLYGLVAIAALVNRLRNRGQQPLFKMWLWPAPPIVALVGTVLVLTQQARRDLLICAAIFVVGVLYYYLFARRWTSGLWRADAPAR